MRRNDERWIWNDISLYGLAIATAVCMPVGSFKPLTKSTKHQEEYRHQYLQRGGAEVTSL